MRHRTNTPAQSFALGYESRLPDLRKLASFAEEKVREALEPLNLDLHLVSARAKDLSTAVAKIRRKKYGKPWQQLTDQVGVRVIVYYPEDVDRVSAALRDAFEVDNRRSVDKRRELQVRQFGYRSVHLIVRLGNRLPTNIPTHLGRLSTSQIELERRT